MFGICPKDSLNTLIRDSAEQSRLLNLWHKAGLITGSPFNWAPVVALSAKTAVEPRPTMPEFRAESPNSEVKTSVSIVDLVNAYKTALRALKAKGEPYLKQRNILNFFRIVSRRHDPQRILKAIPAFIAHQAGSANFSVSAMDVYFKHTLPRKK